MAFLDDLAYGLDSPVAGSGSSAAPVAGTAVATIASGVLPAGTYDVAVITRNSPLAAADETDALSFNMELRAGAAVKQNRLKSDRAPGHLYTVTDVQLDGSTALTVNATQNATASTIYRACIIANRTS